MAAYSKYRSTTQTLSTTVLDTVSLMQRWDGVEVENITGSSALAVTVDGSTPVLDGDDCYHVEPSQSLKISTSTYLGNSTTVQVIGSGNKYRVTGLGRGLE